VLWENKFEFIDRVLLLSLYRLLGKRIVLTAHNVNKRERDGNDSALNRITLRIQYRLADHIFVHTAAMKRQMQDDFSIPNEKITVIPFGINDTVPTTALTGLEARQQLRLSATDKVLLFFGNIAPYKGLEHLAAAFAQVAREDPDLRLVIVGRPKGDPAYWGGIHHFLSANNLLDRTVTRIEYVPDAETEIFFKAADVLVLPYLHIFQSGVLFLGYNFGLPTVASDVGALKEEVVEGETGFICRPGDAADLAATIGAFFASDLFHNLERRRQRIRDYAVERYSWSKVAAVTEDVYEQITSS
jgi:glycosyltransferase involved in cell wall biosynthesis